MEMLKQLMVAGGCALLLAIGGCATNGGTRGQEKVIYHINEGLAQASGGLRNIGNHLRANPDAKIVVVTHSKGVDFLMKGAKDKNGNKYEYLVEPLKLRGVRFEVCENTLASRGLSKDQFIGYATFVPSGVAEVARLQQREGYAYLKP